jgi:hypothetical protein
MSDTIFYAVPGRLVVALQGDDAQSFKVVMKGVPMIPGIATGLRVSQQVSAQFQVTLDKSLFVIPFGDDAGQMSMTVVHGMECRSSGTGVTDGVQSALQWYKKYKFQRDNMAPVTVGVGSSVFKGYVINFAIDAQAAEGGMVRGQLNLVAWNVQ